MNTMTSVATSLAKKYIDSEKMKQSRDEYAKSHGLLFGKIRGPFSDTNLYYC